MADADAVLDRLAGAWSLDHGKRLLAADVAGLTADVPAALAAEAVRLRAEGDAGGAAEREAWAARARALITRRDFLARVPENKDEFDRRLAEFASRFDDELFDLWLEIAAAGLQPSATGDDAATDLVLLGTVAAAANRPDRAAEIRLYEGTRLLLLAQRAPADEARRQAAIAVLQRCAEDQAATPSVRARAECNLAVLAGHERPGEVAAHQARAQAFAERGDDPALLRRIRRDRAWWTDKAADTEATLALLRANIDAIDAEIWKCRAPIAVRALVQEMLPDIRGAIDICLERGKTDPAWFERAAEYAEHEKSRPFLRAAALVARSLGPVPPRLQRRRAMLEEESRRIGAGLKQIAELDPSAQARANALLDALGAVEAEIETACLRAVALDMQCRPLDFPGMIAEVPPGAAILSLYVMPERTIAFVLTQAGLAGAPLIVDIPESRIAQIKVELQLAINIRRDYTTYNQLQARLDMKLPFFWPEQYLRYFHDRLFAPLADRLAAVTQLWISPHAALLGVPLHALAGADDIPVNDRWAIAYTPGIAVLARCRRAQRTQRERLFATGTDARGEALRGTREEAAAVAAAWQTAPEPATLAAVLSDGAAADILHLGCHSDRTNASTAYQGLALDDGLLTALRIAATPFAASLVTLSACEAAGGDTMARAGDELAGMIGAFLRAGVPSVVATLWPLDDRMAVPLMTAFYAELRKPGASIAAALALAAKTVRLNSPKPYRHPYFWAPFCLWGNA